MYQIKSEGIDYLSIRLTKDSQAYKTALGLVENSPKMELVGTPFSLIYRATMTQKDKVSGESESFRILDITNRANCHIGILRQVVYCSHGKTGTSGGVFDSIDLQGNFFTAYPEKKWLDQIYWLFNVNPNKPRTCGRIDYRFDIYAETDEIVNIFRKSERMVRDSEKRFEKAKKGTEDKHMRKHSEFGVQTWAKIKTDETELVCYDKKLDILDKSEKMNFKKEDGTNPFKSYLSDENPITRIEYRKNSRRIRNTEKNSLNDIIACMRNDTIKAIEKTGIQIGVIKGEKTYSKRPEKVAYVKRIEKVKAHSLTMISAYIRKLDILNEHTALLMALYNRYGNGIIEELKQIHDGAMIEYSESIFCDFNE